MIPVLCSTSPDYPYGDCLRACVASVLELPSKDVPHFFDHGATPAQATESMRLFLDDRSLMPFQLSFGAKVSALKTMRDSFPDVHYLLLAGSHCVVARNDKIVHDPALVPGGLDDESVSAVIFVVK